MDSPARANRPGGEVFSPPFSEIRMPHPSPSYSPTLRPETPSDQAFLHHLLEESQRQELAGLDLPPTLLSSMVKTQLRTDQTAHAAADHRRHIIEVDGQNVGRLIWRPEPTALHMVELRLLPARCGRGLGTALLTDLQRQIADTGLGLCLLVAPFNPARRFYLRLDFVEITMEGPMIAMAWRPK